MTRKVRDVRSETEDGRKEKEGFENTNTVELVNYLPPASAIPSFHYSTTPPPAQSPTPSSHSQMIFPQQGQ